MESLGKILLVDDEINVLKALTRLLSTEPYEVITALGGKEALEILSKDGTFDIIIADYKMPDMNGLELLKRVKALYPHIYRCMLSGYVENDVAYEALSCGDIFSYFTKPWTGYDFVEKLTNLLTTVKILKEKNLLELLVGVSRLPTLDETYTNLKKAIVSNEPLPVVAQIIKNDIAFSAKVLQIANSVFYNTRCCSTIEQAIMIIGLDALDGIGFIYSILRNISLSDNQKEWLNEVVRESLMINNGMLHIHTINKLTEYKFCLSSLGALINIGKVLLLAYMPERYRAAKELQAITKTHSFYEAEVELGYDIAYDRVGGMLLSIYNIPSEIVQIVLFQNSPNLLKGKLNNVVKMLGAVSRLVDYMTYEDAVGDEFFESISSAYGIEKSSIVSCYEHIKDNFFRGTA
jgi:CheY-like chemotaxis protein